MRIRDVLFILATTSLSYGQARYDLLLKGGHLIDLHAHVFGYSGSIFPDDSALIAGTTTVVDAGGSGWRTFDEMYERVIKPSRTRVLALINIVGHGMIGAKYEDDVTDMDETQTAD